MTGRPLRLSQAQLRVLRWLATGGVAQGCATGALHHWGRLVLSRGVKGEELSWNCAVALRRKGLVEQGPWRGKGPRQICEIRLSAMGQELVAGWT